MKNRVLITSIPCWNQRSGANTYSSLFEDYGSENLANIYISPEFPDSNICSRYFNIREWQVVKSVFNRTIKTGEEINVQDRLFDNTRTKEFSRTTKFSRKRKRLFLWLREVAWKLGKWKSRELDDFLADFNPDVLVFSIESYPYFNRLNEYIINKIKPRKVIGYLWDDNFTYKQFPNSIIFKLERYFLRKQVRNLINLCTDVLAISPKMKKECDAEFNIESILLTKPLRKSDVSSYVPHSGILRFLYTGALTIGRDSVILDLAEAINNINQTNDLISLDVYTMTPMSDHFIEKISKCKLCSLHSSIPQEKAFKLQENSDVLIFVESLDATNQIARLSFSTKITDYLSCKRCVLVIGQENNASVEYFMSQDAAIVCDDKNKLYDILTRIITTPSIISEYAHKAEKCGDENHSRDKILTKLNSIING